MFNELIDHLKAENEDLEEKIDGLKSQINNKNIEIDQLNDVTTTQKGKIQSLQRENQLLNGNIGRVVEDSKSQNETITSLRNRIREIEQENLSISTDKKDTKIELDRAIKLRQELEHHLEKLRTDNLKSRETLDTSVIAKTRVQVKLL